MEEYAPIIKSVFKRFGIPYFLDRRELLSEQASARFLLSACAAAVTWETDDVLDFVKNPLFPIKTDGFESYVLKYNISYSRFTSPFTVGGEDERASAEEIRGVLCSVLAPLAAVAGENRAPTGAVLAAIRDFYAASSYSETFTELSEKIRGDSPFYAECLEQSEKKLREIFTEIENVYGDAPIRFSAFTELLASMCASVKIALVPLYIDTVFVGDLGESRYADIKALFLAGASQNAIPHTGKRVAVLNEYDESAFERRGKPLISAAGKTARYGVFFLIQLLIKAKEFITVSYSELSRSGETLAPSSLFGELAAVLRKNGKPLKTETPRVPDAAGCKTDRDAAKAFARFFATEANAVHELGKAAGSALPPERAAPYAAAYAALSREARARVDRAVSREVVSLGAQTLDKSMSASRLESYFACPYAHYFRYWLRLNKRDEGGLEATDAGLIIHDVLERFFKFMIRRGNRYDLPDGEISAVAENIADAVIREKYLRQAERPSDRHFLERVKRECSKTAVEMSALARESGFKPWLIEARIGDGDWCHIPALKLSKDGFKTEIEGKIDRVDRFGDYIAVIDYKSYAGAELKLRQIMNGEKIQLPVYLDAVLRSDAGLIPAAAAYLPVYDKFDVKNNEKRYRYNGIIAAPTEILRQLDPDFHGGKRSRAAESAGATARFYKGLKTEEIFPALLSYVEELVLTAAEEISGGEISPSPLKGKCSYCDYAALCGYKEFVKER
jgi:ATP-dependent helicase/nuclease subunit B